MRGHDQAAVVAGGVARTMRIARRRALRRVGSGSQTGHTEVQRRVGPQYIAHPRVVHGKRVLLVDDVMTTGTSLHRAKAALHAAGAREVRCAVVAHVPLRRARQSLNRQKVG
ncbi:MAG: phosphoribosyltransferase [Actinobacteria bacterium]|nr:phosphoribosyltransferase [Actinomycetota bacterium]